MLSAIKIVCFSALTVACMAMKPDTTNKKLYTGSAFDVKTSKNIYTEEHQEIIEARKHTLTITTYKDNKGKAIAKRLLDFSRSNTCPDFKLEDNRLGYLEGAEVNGKSVKVYFRIKSTTPLKEKVLTIPEPFVIDGGFNYYLKSNWDEMMKGKILSFNFVVPVRLDYYKFRVRKIKETTAQGKKAVVVNLEPDNFIIRKLVDPIVITYDIESKRILVYEGISNINNDEGQNYVARLVYPNLGP
jgi:hypothetical protein